MDIQLRGINFNGSDPVSIINFLSTFQTACNTNGVHEGAAMWIFQFFLKDAAKALVKSRTTATKKKRRKSSSADRLTSYSEVVHFLLKTYATDEVLAEAYADVQNYAQPSGMSEIDYSRRLYDKALRCGNVFSDQVLKGIFVEGIGESIRAHVRNYLAEHPDVDLTKLA